MSTQEILTHIQDSALAHLVSKSNHLVGAGLQIVHVLGFVVLLATLLLISLRLLGLIFTERTVPQVARGATTLLWWGLAAAAATGLLMFIATPLLYVRKPVFLVKLALLVVAVVGQLTLFRKVAALDDPQPALARATAVAALLIWFGVAAAGRAIGFT